MKMWVFDRDGRKREEEKSWKKRLEVVKEKWRGG
jgi:hypothetical protein